MDNVPSALVPMSPSILIQPLSNISTGTRAPPTHSTARQERQYPVGPNRTYAQKEHIQPRKPDTEESREEIAALEAFAADQAAPSTTLPSPTQNPEAFGAVATPCSIREREASSSTASCETHDSESSIPTLAPSGVPPQAQSGNISPTQQAPNVLPAQPTERTSDLASLFALADASLTRSRIYESDALAVANLAIPMLTAPASGLATPNFGTPLLSPHLAFPRSMPAILSPHLLPSPLAPTAPLLSPHFGFDASGAVTPVPAQTAGSVFTFASPSVLSAPVSPTQLQAVRRQPPPRVFVPCPPDEKAGPSSKPKFYDLTALSQREGKRLVAHTSHLFCKILASSVLPQEGNTVSLTLCGEFFVSCCWFLPLPLTVICPLRLIPPFSSLEYVDPVLPSPIGFEGSSGMALRFSNLTAGRPLFFQLRGFFSLVPDCLLFANFKPTILHHQECLQSERYASFMFRFDARISTLTELFLILCRC
eukprot:m.408682 g.408682  ORF g.408682 m.408682 type:complete len:480 (-) comp56510_c0_seq10:506-1945(-)